MSDGTYGGRFWALITLAAAIISSPLLLHLYTHGSATAPPPNQVIEVKFPDWVYQARPPAKPTDPGGTVAASLVEPGTESRAPSPDQAIGSQRVFTMAELAQLTSWQLDVLRNEIYARHGRSFNRADLREYFEHQPWYKPIYPPDGFPEGILNPTERYNANLIAEFQRTH